MTDSFAAGALQSDLDLVLWLHAEAAWRLDRLHSWTGLMELLDEHWPADIFKGESEESDPGPRIVSLILAIDKVAASRRDWAAEALRLDQAYEETVKALSEEIAWQKHAYRDGTDKVATGRTIGMDNALRTLTEMFASRPVCAVHQECTCFPGQPHGYAPEPPTWNPDCPSHGDPRHLEPPSVHPGEKP